MKDIKVYEGCLAKFDRCHDQKAEVFKIKNGKIKPTQTMEFTVVRTFNCIVDPKENNAIDLETNKIYHVVRRDENGNIIKEEYEKILEEDFIVLHYYPKVMDDMSLIYKLFLIERAKNVYKKYKENLKSNNEHQKVKKMINKVEK